MVYLMAIMMVTMLSLGLVSCDSDDDDDNVKITSPIVGTWKTGISSVNATVVFNSDATVIWNSLPLTVKRSMTRAHTMYQVALTVS